MSENWKYQASPKVGDLMYNIRGEDAQEFETNLLDFPFAAAAQFQANLAGAQALGQITQPQAPPIPTHSSGIAPQPAQPPAWAQPQQGPQLTKVCPACSSQAPWSSTKRGGMFKCPNYKGVKNPDGSWAHNGNGHLMEFTQ